MLATDTFVFLHVPKTGGSFVQRVIRDHTSVRPYSSSVHTHTTYEELPEKIRHGREIVFAVRNPWDWYVSWWSYVLAKDRSPRDPVKRATWKTLFAGGNATFAEFVRRACTGDFAHPLASAQSDIYSGYVRAIVGPALDDATALRFEDLRTELSGLLRRHGLLTPDLQRDIGQRPAIKASEHGPYPDYYDDELRELVGRKTAWLRERFNYRF